MNFQQANDIDLLCERWEENVIVRERRGIQLIYHGYVDNSYHQFITRDKMQHPLNYFGYRVNTRNLSLEAHWMDAFLCCFVLDFYEEVIFY